MTSRRPDEPSLPPGQSRPGLFESLRGSLGLPIATLALLAAVAALVLVLLAPFRQPAQPAPQPSSTPPPTITPTSPPTPTATLAPGVQRVLVAQFSGSDGDFEVAQSVEGSLLAAVASEGGSDPVQVVLIPDEITTHEQARDLLATYDATLAIWGDVESDGIRARTTLTRIGPAELPRVHDAPRATPLFFPTDLEYFLTRDLGADTTFLALATLGQLDLARGEYQMAEARFQSALLTMPAALPREARDRGVGVVRFYYGLIALEQGDPIEALESYSLAIRLYPGFTSALNNRGTVYFALGDYQTALAEFDTLLQSDPQNPVALGNRALALLATGESDDALLDAERLVTSYPDDPHSVNLRGIVHYLRADYEDALEDFILAADLAPDSASPPFNRAATLDALGEYEQAVEVYTALLDQHPDDALARVYRGNAYLSMGREADAVTDYDEALKGDLNFVYAYQQRAQYYIGRGNYSVALVDLETALEISDDDPRTLTLLGDLYAAQGDLEAAEAAYDTALEANPTYADALAGRGGLRRLRRSFIGAREDLEAALDAGLPSQERLGTFLLDIGFVYFEQGQYEEALEAFEDALEVGADPALAYTGLAIALESQQRADEADAALQQALDADPRLANLDALAEEPGWSNRALVRMEDILERLEG